MSDDINDDERQARAAFADGNFVLAETLFRQMALSAPRDAVAHYNLGVALGKLDRIEEALGCYRRTIELNPHFTDAYINFGVCLNELNMAEQARRGFALARQVSPDNPVPVLNEGISALALGDYAAGWKDFAARWRLPAYAKFKRDFPQSPWNGEDLSGKTLFLFAEQGFGDTIQMARYVPVLAARGANIIIEAPPALTRLLQSLQGNPRIIAKGEPVPDFDFHCALMDVPRVMETRLETIPAAVPYLFADETEIASYKKDGQRRIGLSWAGRPTHEGDRNRSLAFSQLAPLLKNKNIEWVSLQRVVGDKDAQELAASTVLDWGQGFSDFAACAAAIMALDLVITVDTAIAHLAGALGKPVWILLPFYADWRWLQTREDSPWYPGARLFRQKTRKGWAEVIDRVSAELA